MSIDMCRLTEDLLPLYLDDLLSPETRRSVEEHAATCPACADLISGERAAPAPLPEPVDELVSGEDSARRFIRRVRRLLFYGVVGLVALLVGVSSLSYLVGSRRPPGRYDGPVQVADSFDLARKLVPGWERALAAGQVVPLNVTESIPGSNASVTFEYARFGERESYILYTVQAPEGEHLTAAMAHLRNPSGTVHWPQGHPLGGFSEKGYHQVMWVMHQPLTPESREMALTVRRWKKVTPEMDGAAFGRSPWGGGEMTLTLPVPAGALAEQPETYRLNQSATWLGRSLSLEQLEVGLREARLTASIQLPEGEAMPYLWGSLHFGGEERRLRFAESVDAGGGRWRVVMKSDPPSSWPVPVHLELTGIPFVRRQPLIMELPWNRFRGGEQTELKGADRISVPFYDSQIALNQLFDYGRGLDFRVDWPERPAVVRHLAGNYDTVSLTAPNGEVITNFGGGSGRDEGPQESWSIYFDESDEERLQNAPVLTLRVEQPRAVLELSERWALEVLSD